MLNILNKTSILKAFLSIFSISMLLSHNLIYFFISWVGLNISLYSILLGAGTVKNTKSIGPSEVVLKYFIVGAMLTTFFLFTMVLYAVNYLTFDINTLSYFYLLGTTENLSLSINISEKLFFTSIIAILLFKLGAFPFHFYLSDIYSILCPKSTMFIYTVTLKIIVFLTIIEVISNYWFLSEIFYPIIVISAMGSIISGAIGALSQYRLKQFFAYSYLNSIGFILLALSSGISYGFGAITFYSSYVYFISYILAWLIIWIYFKNITFKVKSAELDAIYFTYGINSLFTPQSGAVSQVNLINNNANISSLVLALVSLLGLPPTLGFYAKALVYFGLMGSVFGQILIVITLVFTPLMAYSYLKLLIKIIYPVVLENTTKVKNTKHLGISNYQNTLVSFDVDFLKLFIVVFLTTTLVFSPILLITFIAI